MLSDVHSTAFFTASGAGYEPTPSAQSHWGEDHLSGPAMVGLAALALENACAIDGFQPVRLTVDLVRAARSAHTTVEVEVVRDGRRMHSARCEVMQSGRVVTRATLVQFRASAPPPGDLWASGDTFPFHPSPEGTPPYVGSDAAGWTRSPAEHQNDSRKRYFNDPISIVAGQRNSPFVRAATVAESTSLVTNLGTAGVGYINGDLTVALSRLPVDDWVGVQALSHHASAGIAVGTATLFDRLGAFGSGLTTAVANPAAQIDFTTRDFRLPGIDDG